MPMRPLVCAFLLALPVIGQPPAKERAAEIAAARRAVTEQEAELGADHPAIADALNHLGFVLWRQGRYAEALPVMERALEIERKHHGDDHVRTADAMSQVAAQLNGLARHEDAERYRRRALAVFEKRVGADHPRTATILDELGQELQAQARYREAEPLFRRGLAIRERHFGVDDSATASSLNNLGAVLWAQGRYEAAEEPFRRAVPILEKRLGAEHPHTATTLSNLASVLQDQGRYQAAAPLYRRALTIVDKQLGADHPSTAFGLVKLAALFDAQRRHREAEPLHRRALAIHEERLGAEHPMTAGTLANLACMLVHDGRSAEAEPLCRRALAIREKRLGAEHPGTAHSLDDLALLLRTQGRFREAEPFSRRALSIREDRLGPRHSKTLNSVNGLALLLWFQGRHRDAEPMFRRVLAVEEQRGVDHPSIAAHLANLLGVRAELGDAREAFALGEQLCDRNMAWVSQELGLSPGVRRFAVARRQQLGLDLLLSALSLFEDRRSRLDPVYRRICAWKGLVFRHVVRLGHALGTRRIDAGTEKLRRRLRELKGMLGKLAYARRILDVAAHRQRFDKLRAEQRDVEVELLGKLGIKAEPEATDGAELARLLPDRTALLDFMVHTPAKFEDRPAVMDRGGWDAPRVLCWITTPGAEHTRLVDLGEAEPLREAVEAYLDKIAPALRGARRRGAGGDPAARLRELLWKPLAAHLAGTTRLLVIPERFLGQLPFGAIEIAKGRYLLEVADVVYAQDAVTLRDRLAAGAPGRAAGDAVLALGAVDYHERAAGDATRAGVAQTRSSRGFERNWPPLSQTGIEVDALIELHRKQVSGDGKSSVLRGSDATEEALKRAVAGYAVVHLATHGFFEREGVASLWESALAQIDGEPAGIGGALRRRQRVKPLEGVEPGLLAGLILAGANRPTPDGRDDGVLTAAEVAALPLASCELAVLSACQTALGTGRSGEGLQSMRRAFHEAGARTVVSSLWKVDDAATRQLMTAFYRRLWQDGAPVAGALRAARLELLRNKATSAPKFWAAFTLSGEWR